jgi:hypothetical protein
MRKFLKDLLYNADNQHLDISRFCSLVANIAYWGVATYNIFEAKASIDLLQLGAGWAAIAGGSAAWIFARQSQEAK